MNVIALNYAQCIKTEAHWGYDKFHNICTGTWSSVHWGSWDWTAVGIGISIFTALLTFAVVSVAAMVAADRAQAKMLEKFAF